MAKSILPVRVRNNAANREPGLFTPIKRFFVRSTFLATIGAAALVAGITPIAKPILHDDNQTSAPVSYASLEYSGSEIKITGSVEQLFQSDSFVGPTSSQKRDRLLPRVEVLEVAGSFLVERTRIAALRTTPTDRAGIQDTSPIVSPVSIIDSTPRITLAAIDPALASSALSAIENVTPLDPTIPLPNNVSEQLAYSRANTPTTERAVSTFSEREQWCLSTGIYFEARGEPYRGQVAVAQVIMNRVKHSQYPDTICGVVFQNQSWKNRCQFSFACDGIPERVNDSASWATAEEITDKVTSGELYLAEVSNATHYHANYVYPHWASRMKRVTRIGAHIFYRFRS